MADSIDVTYTLFEAFRAYQLYTFRAPDCRKALEAVCASVAARCHPVVLEVRGDRIREDRRPLAGDEVAILARLLNRHELPGIQLQEGLTSKSVAELLVMLDAGPAKLQSQGGLSALLERGMLAGVALPGVEPPAPGPSPEPASAPPPLHLEPEHFLEASWADQPTGIFLDFFTQTFSSSRMEYFYRGIERLLLMIGSPVATDRARALSGFRAMGASLAEGSVPLLPTGILPYLADRLAEAWGREPEPFLREAYLEAFGALYSGLAIQGDTMSGSVLLARLEAQDDSLPARMARRPSTVLPLVACFHREGRTALEDKVLPALRLLGPEAARPLVDLLGEETGRPNRLRLLELLKSLGSTALNALRRPLDDSPWHLTRNLVLLLGELRDPALYDALRPHAQHGDPRVRRAAAQALLLSDYGRAEADLPALYAHAEPALQQELQNLLARLAPVT